MSERFRPEQREAPDRKSRFVFSRRIDEFRRTMEMRTRLREEEERATREAVAAEETERIEMHDALATSDFLKGKIDSVALNSRLLRKYGESYPGEIEINDFQELSILLKSWTESREDAQSVAEHEQAHYDTALELGWRAKLLFVVSRNEDDSLRGRPVVHVDVPIEGDQDEIRSKLRRIVEVVDDDLSDLDELMVGAK